MLVPLMLTACGPDAGEVPQDYRAVDCREWASESPEERRSAADDLLRSNRLDEDRGSPAPSEDLVRSFEARLAEICGEFQEVLALEVAAERIYSDFHDEYGP